MKQYQIIKFSNTEALNAPKTQLQVKFLFLKTSTKQVLSPQTLQSPKSTSRDSA